MPFTLLDDAAGDRRNAQALAAASSLAYLGQTEGAAGFRSAFDMKATLYSEGNTQAFVAENEQAIVVAFRGTEAPTSLDGLRDWLLTDAVNLLILPEGAIGTDFAAAGVGARFHQGFTSALAQNLDPLTAAIEAEMRRKVRPVWLTGHSLGGALAQLAAWRLNRAFISIHQVYTFGGPMVGNRLAREAFDREFPNKVFRYVNAPDLVPKLPTVSLIANAYDHCEREMTLAGDGGTALDFLKELAGRALDGLLNATVMDDIWQVLKQRIGAHDITNYEKLVAEKNE